MENPSALKTIQWHLADARAQSGGDAREIETLEADLLRVRELRYRRQEYIADLEAAERALLELRNRV